MNAPLQSPAVERVASLFAEHGDAIDRALRYLGVDGATRDDALQDVFVTAYRRWDSFEGRSTPRTWLYGIARRVAYRYRRKQDTHRALFSVTTDGADGVSDPFAKADAAASVARLLDTLDEAKRAAFVLVEVEGFTAPEAARVLQIPLGTVYSRVRAAWKVLRSSAHEEGLGAFRTPIAPERRRSLERSLLLACGPTVATVGTVSVSAWVLGLAAAGVVAVGAGAAVASSPAPAPAPRSAAPSVAPRSVGTTSKPEPAPRATPSAEAPEATRRPKPVAAPGKPAVKRPVKPSPTEDTLEAEVELLKRARAHLRDGEHAQAEALLREHARRFPKGVMVSERTAAERALAAALAR